MPRSYNGTPPPPRTTRTNVFINLGSTGYWRKNQGFWRKEQGSDGKPGKQETPRKRKCRENDNIKNKPIASLFLFFVCLTKLAII